MQTRDKINEPNSNGMTPLHLAAIQGDLDKVDELLSNGADPCVLNKQKQLPIQSSLFIPIIYEPGLRSQKEAIFNRLLTKDPLSLYHQDITGNTVFHCMVVYGFDTLLINLLSIDSQGAFYHNNFFQRYPIHEAIIKHRLDVTKYLLSIEGVAELVDTKNRLAIHYAAEYGTKEILDECCVNVLHINARDSGLKTPLFLAVEAGNIENINNLINHGADASLVDCQKRTILHQAVISSKKNVVDWILQHLSLDIHQLDKLGKTPCDYCQKESDKEIKDLFTSHCQYPGA